MEIRKAKLKDIPWLVENWQEMMDFHLKISRKDYEMRRGAKKDTCSFFRKRIYSKYAAVFVAGEKGERMGHLIVKIEKTPPVYKIKKNGHIGMIFVGKKHRGRGVATALINKAYEWCREKKMKTVQICVDPRNEKALDLYKNEGFYTHHLLMRRWL